MAHWMTKADRAAQLQCRYSDSVLRGRRMRPLMLVTACPLHGCYWLSL